MPTTSANGSRANRASARSSCARRRPGWSDIAAALLSSVRFVGLDREHRARRVEQDALSVASQDQLSDRRASAQPDDDEVGRGFLGNGDEVVGGVEAANQLADLGIHPDLGELRPDGLQLGIRPDRLGGVEVAPAVGRVDDDQVCPAQTGLLRSPPQGRTAFGLRDVPDDDRGHRAILLSHPAPQRCGGPKATPADRGTISPCMMWRSCWAEGGSSAPARSACSVRWSTPTYGPISCSAAASEPSTEPCSRRTPRWAPSSGWRPCGDGCPTTTCSAAHRCAGSPPWRGPERTPMPASPSATCSRPPSAATPASRTCRFDSSAWPPPSSMPRSAGSTTAL